MTSLGSRESVAAAEAPWVRCALRVVRESIRTVGDLQSEGWAC